MSGTYRAATVAVGALAVVCVVSGIVVRLFAPEWLLLSTALTVLGLALGLDAILLRVVRGRTDCLFGRPMSGDPLVYVPSRHDYRYSGREIPWRGGMGRLVIKRPLFRGMTRLLIDGAEVAAAPRVTLEHPWIECLLPTSDPRVDVVEVQLRPSQLMTLIFADGLSIDDGASIDGVRRRQPRPMDGFEQTFFGLYRFTPKTGLAGGVLAAGPAWFAMLSDPGFGIVAGAITVAVMAGWVMLGALVIDWLRSRRAWPSTLRNLMVALFVFGLPFMLIAAVASAQGG